MKSATIIRFIVFVIFWLPALVHAEEQWHFQATLKVSEPGLIEAVLPAGLFFSPAAADQPAQLDLSLVGPDGNLRSFELYWKEENSTRSVSLEPGKIYTDRNRRLIWEASAPKNFLIESIQIDFEAGQGIGKVTVEAKNSSGWHMLAQNAALYQAEGRLKADVRITPAIAYDQLRLSFSGYDKEFHETPFLVKSVMLTGKNRARDYFEQTADLPFSDKSESQERTISALLPGSGLWIKNLVFSTSALFQGKWRLGRKVMIGGEEQFKELLSGNVTTVSSTDLKIEIPVNRSWPGRSLVLKLDSDGKYLGSIRGLTIITYLPRLVFLADKAGDYRAQSGNGINAAIKAISGDPDRKVNRSLLFSDIAENRMWRPENLVDRFALKGGPFNEKGYRWTAKVMVPEPGYYRLRLNQEASLSKNPEGIRLVKDKDQIPYFMGQSEMQEIILQAADYYDKIKNSSAWTIKLPRPSNKWTGITLESEGIFERKIRVEIPRPGHTGWQHLKDLYWQNLTNDPAVLFIGVGELPKDTDELRLTMDHGDNRPIEIRKIKTSYNAPTLFFLINKPGEYTLFGGNAEATEAKFDLSLVQAHLMEAAPMPAVMENLMPFRSSSFQLKVRELFDEKAWGLYAVLGAVTLVLIILIIRLFPKDKNGTADR